MKLGRNASIAVPRRGLLPLVLSDALLPLALAAAPACAETRGYILSWFTTATNNPDFVQNCPEAAKNPDR